MSGESQVPALSDTAREFVATHKLCVLATLTKGDGVYTAVMHCSFDKESDRFYFSTDLSSNKVSFLKTHGRCSASLVVGLDDIEWVTVQMTGFLDLVPPDMISRAKQIHYEAVPSSREFEDDPNTVFLYFSPAWSRITDFNTDPPQIQEAGAFS